MVVPGRDVITIEGGVPNPYYYKVLSLVKNMPGLREAMLEARRSGSRSLAKEILRPMAKKVVSDFNAAPDPTPLMPPPPTAGALYNCIADGTELVDVGTGNLQKVKDHSGRLKMTCVDPAIPLERAAENITVLKVRKPFKEVADGVTSIVTSYMSLTQLSKPEIDAVVALDGLHMVPDHESLVKNGVAVESDGGYMIRAPKRFYHDHKLPPMPGLRVNEGYKLAVTYSEERVEIGLLGLGRVRWESGDYSPLSEAKPAGSEELDWSDMGYKFDGEFFEIEIRALKEGTELEVWITRRNAQYAAFRRVGRYDPGFHCCLHVEYLKGANAFVLLRVVSFRGFVPPHTGDCLRYFASRKKFVVCDAPILGPPRYDAAIPRPALAGVLVPVDGVISRVRGSDFYCKPKWTVDLYPEGVQDVSEKLPHHGFLVKVDTVGAGLCEYEIHRRVGEIEISYKCERPDKIQATSIETVVWLCALQNLEELSVLYGGMPPLSGWRAGL